LTVLALIAGALPLAARADVLEISGGDFGWKSGGPKPAIAPVEPSAALAPAHSATAQPAAAMPSAAPHAASVTTISAEAGPAAWRARVAQLAAKYDISPALLEAVVWQESRWNPGAVSPVGARGLTQLMPDTARQMGVNPDNPHANLEGGARYLRQQLDAFGGNVEKALAAYNAGPGRVRAAGGIPSIRETQDYVASIMARLSAPVRK